MERFRRPEISVIIPMYNEEANVKRTLDRVSAALNSFCREWEIIAVDDGSVDRTQEVIKKYSKLEPKVKLAGYFPNQGPGKALRTGFQKAQGEIICSTDADLSYSEIHLVKMAGILKNNPEYDFVVGSPYVQHGRTENVPGNRLLISKLGNKILSYAMKSKITTVTGVLRAYRYSCIKSLELESEGKEIHLEILSKALAIGYKPYEMPAVLKGREKGSSKFRFKATALSHLIFSFFERPIILFGLIGLFLVILGLIGGGYLIYLWQMKTLNPDRPLMTLVALFILTGLQVLLFGFLGTQIVQLRKEIYKIQRENKNLEEILTNTASNSGRRISHRALVKSQVQK